MRTTYFDRLIYRYKGVWKATRLKDIIKQGVGNTIHPKKWYDVFSILLVIGTIILWLLIAIFISPVICPIAAIRKPKPFDEFKMIMNGCGHHKKEPCTNDDNDDLPF